jgi:hypothetical protein
MDPKQNVDVDNLTVSGVEPTPGASVSVTNGVIVIVHRAFGPDGEPLVGISDVTFDDFPAITLLVRADGREGLVHLSPIHGDRRKSGFVDIPAGTKCELLSPTTRRPLDKMGALVPGQPAEYYAIYLTPKLSKGSAIYVSDLWDHYHSRIVHNNELVSAWAAAADAGAGG